MILICVHLLSVQVCAKYAEISMRLTLLHLWSLVVTGDRDVSSVTIHVS